MNLPPPIRAYFDADSRNDAEALVRAFAPDALVTDEGRSHAGHAAIEAWWRAAKAQYEHEVEPLEASEVDKTISVRAKVSGRFPGSPAVLAFAFRLRDGLITALEITA